MKAGNAADAEKWNAAASTVAMKLQAAQNTEEMLRRQLTLADEQSEKAKEAVRPTRRACSSWPPSAWSPRAARGGQDAGEGQRRHGLDDRHGGPGQPSLEEVENKIQARMAQASAKAELDASTGEGAMAELRKSTMELEAPRRWTRCGPSSAGRRSPSSRPDRRRARRRRPRPDTLGTAAPYHAPVIVLVLGADAQREVGLARRHWPTGPGRHLRGHGVGRAGGRRAWRRASRPTRPAPGRVGHRRGRRRPRRRAPQPPRRHDAGRRSAVGGSSPRLRGRCGRPRRSAPDPNGADRRGVRRGGPGGARADRGRPPLHGRHGHPQPGLAAVGRCPAGGRAGAALPAAAWSLP